MYITILQEHWVAVIWRHNAWLPMSLLHSLLLAVIMTVVPMLTKHYIVALLMMPLSVGMMM